ncbi:MAG: cupin domain-containing protein [Cytophagaceae bacterium]|jgi:mannose-6-phosphate isomerase-like protein (cupin superfamily)|nr:cupin domain-containing protein [Cytophagaceae bacterium]
MQAVYFDEAFSQVLSSKQELKQFISHGSMLLELYHPNERDMQNPHDQDELYVIAKGKSSFVLETNQYEVKAGDVLFVKAGQVHRFENFTEDFSTWVIFYGPKGGEQI